jgi:fructose-bisphosphate aldolase class II
MSLVNMKEMLTKAKKEKYAVGQFNINNLEWTLAILDECQALESPVILGVSFKFFFGTITIISISLIN